MTTLILVVGAAILVIGAVSLDLQAQKAQERERIEEGLCQIIEEQIVCLKKADLILKKLQDEIRSTRSMPSSQMSKSYIIDSNGPGLTQ